MKQPTPISGCKSDRLPGNWIKPNWNFPSMTEKFQNVIQSASRTLALLSKVRCVESYSPSPECKPKTLYSWPSQLKSDAEIISLLAEKGGDLNGHYRVRSYPVSYDIYEKLKTIDIPEVTNIRSNRVLLDVFQIVATGKRVTNVTAAWDTLQYPDRTFPTSMSDIQGLDDFSVHKDSMLVFDRDNEKYSIKLRASAYRSVLRAKPELKSFTISPEDRSAFIGKGSDGKGRSKRFVVHSGNRDHLQNVLRQTNDSIEKLFGDNDW